MTRLEVDTQNADFKAGFAKIIQEDPFGRTKGGRNEDSGP